MLAEFSVTELHEYHVTTTDIHTHIHNCRNSQQDEIMMCQSSQLCINWSNMY